MKQVFDVGSECDEWFNMDIDLSVPGDWKPSGMWPFGVVKPAASILITRVVNPNPPWRGALFTDKLNETWKLNPAVKQAQQIMTPESTAILNGLENEHIVGEKSNWVCEPDLPKCFSKYEMMFQFTVFFPPFLYKSSRCPASLSLTIHNWETEIHPRGRRELRICGLKPQQHIAEAASRQLTACAVTQVS